jgi:hypothetical protein
MYDYDVHEKKKIIRFSMKKATLQTIECDLCDWRLSGVFLWAVKRPAYVNVHFDLVDTTTTNFTVNWLIIWRTLILRSEILSQGIIYQFKRAR